MCKWARAHVCVCLNTYALLHGQGISERGRTSRRSRRVLKAEQQAWKYRFHNCWFENISLAESSWGGCLAVSKLQTNTSGRILTGLGRFLIPFWAGHEFLCGCAFCAVPSAEVLPGSLVWWNSVAPLVLPETGRNNILVQYLPRALLSEGACFNSSRIGEAVLWDMCG